MIFRHTDEQTEIAVYLFRRSTETFVSFPSSNTTWLYFQPIAYSGYHISIRLLQSILDVFLDKSSFTITWCCQFVGVLFLNNARTSPRLLFPIRWLNTTLQMRFLSGRVCAHVMQTWLLLTVWLMLVAKLLNYRKSAPTAIILSI